LRLAADFDTYFYGYIVKASLADLPTFTTTFTVTEKNQMTAAHQLVRDHISYAEKIAFKKKKSLPKFVDIDEIKSAAYLGLVEAANRFDLSRGVDFKTFSFPRIVGAICDYLRERRWSKQETMLSLDSSHTGDGHCLADNLQAKSSSSAGECFEELTVVLGHEGREIMRQYFIEDLSMREIGSKIGLSESRISQLVKSFKISIRESRVKRSLELAA
jgi:RNA polymerase sigma factor (sigma-70 family)